MSFKEDFKTVRVDSRRYLLHLIRYIHLNPVRAGIVARPEDYKWSGHNSYLGTDPYVWVERDYVLARFSEERVKAISRYNEFVYAGIGVEPEFDFESGIQSGILGDDNFVKEILEGTCSPQISEKTLSISKIIEKVCIRYNVSRRELSSSAKLKNLSHIRAILALLVRESDTHTLVDLSKILNRDAAGLSHLVKRFEKRCEKCVNLKKEVDDLRKFLFDK